MQNIIKDALIVVNTPCGTAENLIPAEWITVGEDVTLATKLNEMDAALADLAARPVPTLATQTTPGIVKGSDSVIVDAEGGLHSMGAGSAFVGQWVFLRQYPWPGYVGLGGELFENAIIRFPDLIAYLKTRPQECITEADWQARSAAASGKGGVPFYVYDEAANTLRVPDTRQDSWFHGVSGTWEQDGIRNILGRISSANGGIFARGHGGPDNAFFGGINLQTNCAATTTTVQGDGAVKFDSSKVVPTDTTNHPRRIGMTLAVYAGTIGA